MALQPARRWFNIDEYNRMAEAGILHAGDRVELIEGAIIQMSPIGSRHAACVNRLTMLLSPRVAGMAIVSVQNPIIVDEYSQPEPDLALLRNREDYYARELPAATDVLLAVEVADTSGAIDRSIKIPLYARAGIPVVLLVDIPGESIEVYAGPTEGAYTSVNLYRRGETFSLAILPQASLAVDQVLG
jgi:Uma2 family endonuclease